MSVNFYMDVHIPSAIVLGLRRRSVDVVTAQEDAADTLSDQELMNRATALGRVLFSQDEDLVREAVNRQRVGHTFSGIVYSHQQRLTVRQFIVELETIAKACDPSDVENQIIYLPV